MGSEQERESEPEIEKTLSATREASPLCEHCRGRTSPQPLSPLALKEAGSPSSPPRKTVLLEPPRLDGYTRIIPPSTPPSNPTPVLRRCRSDPSSTPATQNGGNLSAAARSASLPPLPPSTRRCASEPTHSPLHPPRTANNISRSPSPCVSDAAKEESPNTKRLKRMREKMREINRWWESVMREDEDEDGRSEGALTNNSDTKEESEPACEELVSVEKAGESFSLNFKCPCGKTYQILLAGKSCYYKLT